MRMALVLEDDVVGVLGVHHLVREPHAVEPTRGKQGALFDERTLEEVALLVLAALAVAEDEEGSRIVATKLLQRGLDLQALLCADSRRLPVSLKP